MIERSVERVCRECGSAFRITEGEIGFLRDVFARRGGTYTPPSRCPGCRARRRQERYSPLVTDSTPPITRACLACGLAFTFPDPARPDEQQYFIDRGWMVPSRCPGCRRRRSAACSR